jgi:hypothetical protein
MLKDGWLRNRRLAARDKVLRNNIRFISIVELISDINICSHGAWL